MRNKSAVIALFYPLTISLFFLSLFFPSMIFGLIGRKKLAFWPLFSKMTAIFGRHVAKGTLVFFPYKASVNLSIRSFRLRPFITSSVKRKVHSSFNGGV